MASIKLNNKSNKNLALFSIANPTVCTEIKIGVKITPPNGIVRLAIVIQRECVTPSSGTATDPKVPKWTVTVNIYIKNAGKWPDDPVVSVDVTYETQAESKNLNDTVGKTHHVTDAQLIAIRDKVIPVAKGLANPAKPTATELDTLKTATTAAMNAT